MRFLFPLLCFFAAGASFAACTGETHQARGQWDLLALVVDGAEVEALETNRPVLTLDSDVSGNGGCNSFRGQYDVDGDSLVFRALNMTERACAEADRNEQEVRFFAALGATASFERDGTELRFFDASGALLARFER